MDYERKNSTNENVTKEKHTKEKSVTKDDWEQKRTKEKPAGAAYMQAAPCC